MHVQDVKESRGDCKMCVLMRLGICKCLWCNVFFEVPRDFVAASAPATLGYVWLPASGPASKECDAFTLGPVATHHRPISIYIYI